jgi:ferritin
MPSASYENFSPMKLPSAVETAGDYQTLQALDWMVDEQKSLISTD